MSTLDATARDATIEWSDPARLVAAPVVSVVMTVYNHGAYLAQAIDSVLSQETPFACELLVGEDCSTDDSRAICERFLHDHPGRVRIISSAANVGGARNWERLMRAARGRYIAHLDGDDWWLPGKLALQVAFLAAHPDHAAVYANATAVDAGGTAIGRFNDVGAASFDLAEVLRRGNVFNTSSMLFRASLLPELLRDGGLPIDYRAHLRLARHGLVAQLGESLAVYRAQSATSMLGAGNARVRQLYWEAILDARGHVAPRAFARGIADFLRRVAFRSLRTRRRSLWSEWAPTVFAASPCGRVRTAALVAAAIGRAACKELAGAFAVALRGSRARVLYRR